MADQQPPSIQPGTPRRKRDPSTSLSASKPRSTRKNFTALERALVDMVTQRNPILSYTQISDLANNHPDAPRKPGSRGSGGWIVRKLKSIGTRGGDHELAVRLRHTGDRWRNICLEHTFWDDPTGWDGSRVEIVDPKAEGSAKQGIMENESIKIEEDDEDETIIGQETVDDPFEL